MMVNGEGVEEITQESESDEIPQEQKLWEDCEKQKRKLENPRIKHLSAPNY